VTRRGDHDMDMEPKQAVGMPGWSSTRAERESSVEAACVSEGGRRVRLVGSEGGGRCGEFCMLK
jgi:hypothetical protein